MTLIDREHRPLITLNIHQGKTSLLGEFKWRATRGWRKEEREKQGGRKGRVKFSWLRRNDSWRIGNTDLSTRSMKDLLGLLNGQHSLSLSLALFFFLAMPAAFQRSIFRPCASANRNSIWSCFESSCLLSLPLSFLSLTQIIISIGALLFLIVGWSCRVWHWTCTVLIKYHRYSSTVGNSIGARIASFFFFFSYGKS